MADDSPKQFADLVRDLDTDVEDFEDLLDLLEKQTAKTTGAVQTLSRLLVDTREDLAELREGIEVLTQKVDRLVVVLESRVRDAGECGIGD